MCPGHDISSQLENELVLELDCRELLSVVTWIVPMAAMVVT
jgi:hypothetical protein